MQTQDGLTIPSIPLSRVQTPAEHIVKVKTICDGPFRGRKYAQNPITGQWKRAKHLEKQTPGQQREKMRRMVALIPDQAHLDAILAGEPDDTKRAALLELWRPWLSFTLTETPS